MTDQGRHVHRLFLADLIGGLRASAHQIAGRILGGAHDGDTIKLLGLENYRQSIRLDGIDVPDAGQPSRRASKQHLADLLAGCEAVGEYSNLDRYRRKVCRIVVCGADAAQEQSRAGVAKCLRHCGKKLLPVRSLVQRNGSAFAWKRICKSMRAPTRLPIIALTASAFDHDCAAYLQARMSVHLAKPIDPETLDANPAHWTHHRGPD